MKETLRLRSDKDSLVALIGSHAIGDKGGRPEGSIRLPPDSHSGK